MNPEWPAGAKLAYVIICLSSFAAIMWAYTIWVVRPAEDLIRSVAANWPPTVTFGIVGMIFPIWFGTIWWMKRRGLI